MPEVDLNMTVNGYKGTFDKLVFKKYKGRTIVAKRPVFTKAPSEAQVNQREHFAEGVDYGKLAMEDPALRAFYEPFALQRETSIYSAALADFLRKPKVRSVDLSKYKGQVGNTIEIVVTDDTGVVDVQVRITDGDSDLENGPAVESKPRHWIYTAQTDLTGRSLDVIVTAKDLPGGKAEKTLNVETP